MKITPNNILALFVSLGVYTGLDMLTGIHTAFENLRITYAEPFLVFVSTVAGPIFGAITGILGQLILQVREGVLDWPMTGCTALTCLAIGFFTRSLEIDKGIFEKKEMFFFNRVQIITNLIVWALIYPAAAWYFKRTDLLNILRDGVYITVHNVISCALLSTLFLAVYARTRITPENFYRN